MSRSSTGGEGMVRHFAKRKYICTAEKHDVLREKTFGVTRGLVGDEVGNILSFKTR